MTDRPLFLWRLFPDLWRLFREFVPSVPTEAPLACDEDHTDDCLILWRLFPNLLPLFRKLR